MKTICLAALALGACFFSGCARPTNVAVRTLACPADSIEYNTGTNPVVSTGCGRLDVIYHIGNDEWASLRERAAFDLGCSPQEIEVVRIDPMTFGVVGRGQRLVYKHVYGVGFTLDSVTNVESAVTSPAPST
ncbi:MAG: hypothetical protein U0414_09015 [Polyangiaceae bacterium]